MIINCENCNKKFNLNPNLIGENGRLLQCSNCDHKWFFKPIRKQTKQPEIIEKIINKEETIDKENNLPLKKVEVKEKKTINIKKNVNINNIKSKNIKKNNKSNLFINNFIIIIITFFALIIALDTFKYNLSIFFPGLVSLLDSLYESLYDLQLFLKDLIS